MNDDMVGRVGPHAEANPLVSGTFGALGLPALAALKLLVVVLVGALTMAATTRGRQGGLGQWSVDCLWHSPSPQDSSVASRTRPRSFVEPDKRPDSDTWRFERG
jgi:hypothetical protein